MPVHAAHPRKYHPMSPAHGPRQPASSRPQRRCVSCRQTRDKQDLIRIARHGDDVAADLTQTLPGRGSYVCPDLECVDRAHQRDAASLRASLRGGTTNQVLRALKVIRTHLTSAPRHKEHNA